MTDRDAFFRGLPRAPDVAPVVNSPTGVLSVLSVTRWPHDWTRLGEATPSLLTRRARPGRLLERCGGLWSHGRLDTGTSRSIRRLDSRHNRADVRGPDRRYAMALARPRDDTKVEIAGLDWYFVDIVWIAIFTLIYLIP